MLKIVNNILEKELFYDNTVVLKYHIEYPSIETENTICMQKFNDYNKELALDLQYKSENELYKQSVELYKYNKEHGYPTNMYEVYRTYEITFNRNYLLSLFADKYIYTGGAHGNTIRTSQTWNFLMNRMMQLFEFFKGNPYFMVDILKTISNQIIANPQIYFDDACNLMLNAFQPQNFYLTPRGIVIYFQQYDIAPYSSGILTFLI